MGIFALYVVSSLLMMMFILYVENLYRFNVEPDGHELTETNNKGVLIILSFIPIIQYLTVLFFLVKLAVYYMEFSDVKKG